MGLKEEFSNKIQEKELSIQKLESAIKNIKQGNVRAECDCDLITSNIEELMKKVFVLEDDGNDIKIDLARHLQLIAHAEEDINVLRTNDTALHQEDQSLQEMDATLQEEDQALHAIDASLQVKSMKSSICGYTYRWETDGVIKYDGSNGHAGTVYTEVNEVGSVLDGSTGIYTAGADGVYEVTGSGECASNSVERLDLHVAVTTLDGLGDWSNWFMTSSSHEQCGATRFVNMKKGDTIQLSFSRNGSTAEWHMIWHLYWCITLY